MRKHYLLYASAAMIALASCSRETIEVITPEMSTSYAKISISMASAPGTRAWGDADEFDKGTYNESKMALEDIHLVFYDDNGFVVGSGEHIKTSLDDYFNISGETTPDVDRTPGFTAGDTPYVSDDNTVIFKLNLYEGAPLPTKVAAFINVDPTDFNFNLDKLSDIKTNVSTEYETDGKFIMTSAGYYSGSEYMITAPITGDIFTNVSAAVEAKATTADIYVERLAAKVNIDADPEVKQDDQKFIIKTPEDETLTAEFSANKFQWGLTGTADKMYMLKKKFENSVPSWMNGTNRSYWAEGAYWETDYDTFKDNSPLTYLSLKDINTNGKTNGTADYTLEHTYNYAAIKNAPLFSANVASTSAIIIGKYTFKNGTSTLNVYDNGFYLLYQGAEEKDSETVSVFTIYTKDDLIEYLKKDHENIYTKEGDKVTDFDVVKAGTQFKLVKAGTTDDLYFGDGKENEVVDTTKPVPATNARHYVESKGYFFIPIEHYTQGNAEKNGYYGVVRNHSYVLNITSIQGLAAPLDDKYTGEGDGESEGENEPIVPDPDDLKEAYIQASIKVLSWHVVSQDVKL